LLQKTTYKTLLSSKEEVKQGEKGENNRNPNDKGPS